MVGTPIGNLEDISLRALRILKEVDLIAAEDTRHTRKLLSYYDIHTSLTSYFEHNKITKGDYLISLLLEGKNIALVSDAGMPGISDPGEEIVREAISRGITVCPIPGPSASLSLLVVSGLPTAQFVFEGFLPRDKKERETRLMRLTEETRTMIFYESPYRIIDTLVTLKNFLGNRQGVVGRELTKKFEEVVRGSLEELIEHFIGHPPKGEFTLVLAGGEEKKSTKPKRAEIKEELNRLMESGMTNKEGIKELSRKYKLPKNEVYRISLEE